MRIPLPILASALLVLATIPSHAAAPKSAHADLVNAQGTTIGQAKFSAASDGVKVSITVSQLSPGEHGIHIHTVGKCDGPAFTTAGGHFNPTSAHHGVNSTLAPHPTSATCPISSSPRREPPRLPLPPQARHSAMALILFSTMAAHPLSSTPRPTT